MDLDAYLAGYYSPDHVPTPVIVTVNGQQEVRSLSAVLYGAPPPEPVGHLRKRMADLIVSRVSASGNVTRSDLLAGGFTDQEIDKHYLEALRRSRVARLGPDL